MAERIDLPPTLKGTPEEQLQQLRSYLYQMATALNVNQLMAGSETVALTDEERILMNNIANANRSSADQYISGNFAEAETLKSLIIKTAKFVKNVQDNYNMILYGEESAQSDFGNWNRKKGLRVDVTPDGIKQTYSYAEIISGLKNFEINAKSYIKTGYLHDDAQDLPVYGVAIGKDIVTFSEDGSETYVDGKKVAELTADELAFYQKVGNNNLKVASYTGTQTTYYLNGVARLIIDGNGMTIKDDDGNTLAELKGTALSFYQNNVKLAEFSTDSQDQLIQFFENIELPSEINNEKHIKLQSGTSVVLIDPTQISMSTPGLIMLKGSGNSAIDFRDETSGVVMKLDKDGLETQSMKADAAEFETLTVQNLIAEDLPIPKVVYSDTEPQNVHEVVWLKPTSSGTQGSIDETSTVRAAPAHSCTQRARPTFTYKAALQTRLDLTGITTITLSGTFVRQGQDQQNSFTVSASIDCSDGSSVSIGQIASGTLFASYSFSETISYNGNAKTATGITYTLTVADDFAHYSSFSAATMRVQGTRGSHTGTAVECTVYYIP